MKIICKSCLGCSRGSAVTGPDQRITGHVHLLEETGAGAGSIPRAVSEDSLAWCYPGRRGYPERSKPLMLQKLCKYQREGHPATCRLRSLPQGSDQSRTAKDIYGNGQRNADLAQQLKCAHNYPLGLIRLDYYALTRARGLSIPKSHFSWLIHPVTKQTLKVK